MTVMRILFVGSNPSKASKTLAAFSEDARSGRVVRDWIRRAGIEDNFIKLTNVSFVVTPNNRPLSPKEIQTGGEMLRFEATRYDRVVALGVSASKALTAMGIDHLRMPHPSGKNRTLNDPTAVDQAIESLVRYVSVER